MPGYLGEAYTLLDPNGQPSHPGLRVVKDNTGKFFSPDSCNQVIAYSSGKVSTVTATDGTTTWVQTYTYVGTDLTGVSAWVRS